MVTKEDSGNLWEQWRKHPTPQNMGKIVESFSSMIGSVASQNKGVNQSLLRGRGKRLVIDAVKSYDPNSGSKLSTHVYNYLRPMNRQAKALTEIAPLSRHHGDQAASFVRFIQDFSEENGREPDNSEIQDALGLSKRRLEAMNRFVKYEVPEGQLVGDVDQDEQDKDMARLDLWSDYVYHDLTSIDKKIMDFKMGRNGEAQLGNEEIAHKLKLSPMEVSVRAGKIAQKILDGSSTPERMVG